MVGGTEVVARQTSLPIVSLWGLFIYWCVVMGTHQLWDEATAIGKSCGVAAIVGLALNVNSYASSGHETISQYVRSGPFGVMRFFIIPFCVASYSAVANTKKDQFTYLFPNDGPQPLTYTGVALLTVAAFTIMCVALRCIIMPQLPEHEHIINAETSSA